MRTSEIFSVNRGHATPKFRAKGGFAPILIIFVGLVLTVAIGSVVYLKLNPGLPSQNQTTPTQPTQTPSPTTDETANWKTHNNIRYGFSVRYPPNLTPIEEESSDLYLFSISFVEPQKETFSGFSIEIQTGKLGDIVQIEKWRIVGHIADAIKSETKIIKDGQDGVRLEYEYLAGPNEKQESKIENSTIVILNSGNYVYKLNSKSDLMDQILSTFKFTEDSAKSLCCEVAPPRDPCDINEDGRCDIADFDKFKLSLGKKVGEVGYNLSADVDADGVVTSTDAYMLKFPFSITLPAE